MGADEGGGWVPGAQAGPMRCWFHCAPHPLCRLQRGTCTLKRQDLAPGQKPKMFAEGSSGAAAT